ncbi:MAG: AbrB/MazE/SpoVT family DNA-binding domain-containing protein [Candidatus Micrarchaeota archaeon]|nr:AbrB/MazE/SpoVT family DNA-binding domain-containing protein [Candidatus Micrarchaeota archaeon]
MDIETVKVSSKGQLVIPKSAREELGIGEGTLFALIAYGDTIVLKKMQPPSREQFWKDWDKMAAEGEKRLHAKGLTEKDIPRIVEEHRKRNREARANRP